MPKITTTDADYFIRRIAQERSLAERSADPMARRAHVELATRYAQKLGPLPVG